MISLLWSCYSPQEEPFETQVYEVGTDGEGYADLKIRIPENVTSLLATAESGAAVYTEQILDPDKDIAISASDWHDTTRNLSNGVWAFFKDTTMQWPIRATDASIRKGKWRIRWHSPEHIKDDIDVTIITATDDDWNTGDLNVTVCYGEGLQAEPEAMTAVDIAVDHAWGLYEAQGITLVEHDCYGVHPSDLTLLGSVDSVTEERKDLPPATIVLLVGDWIDNDPYQLGYSGSIPGSFVPHPRSYVGVSWLAHAGADGIISDMEARLLGETIGHELGHYLGLFHPVELDLSGTDALEDTPDCDSLDLCAGIYQNHLMHASPVCVLGLCEEQYLITPEQFDILHRHTAVY